MYLVHLEKYRFLVGFHQQVKKYREKDWHNRHIKTKKFQFENLVLLYDSKYLQHTGKFFMHWLGPYVIQQITETDVAWLETLNGQLLERMVKGSQLKHYRDSQ